MATKSQFDLYEDIIRNTNENQYKKGEEIGDLLSEIYNAARPLVTQTEKIIGVLSNNTGSNSIVFVNHMNMLVRLYREIVGAIGELVKYNVDPNFLEQKKVIGMWYSLLEPETKNMLENFLVRKSEQQQPAGHEIVSFFREVHDRDMLAKDKILSDYASKMVRYELQYNTIFFLYSRFYGAINRIRSDPILREGIPESAVLHINLDKKIGYLPGTEGTPSPRPLFESSNEVEAQTLAVPSETSVKAMPNSDVSVLKIVEKLHHHRVALRRYYNENGSELSALYNGFAALQSFSIEGRAAVGSFLKSIPHITGIVKYILNTFGQVTSDQYTMDKVADEAMSHFIVQVSNAAFDYGLKTHMDAKLKAYIHGIRKLTGRQNMPTSGSVIIDWIMEYVTPHTVALKKKYIEINNLKRKYIMLVNELIKFDYGYKSIRDLIKTSKKENDAGEPRDWDKFNGIVNAMPEFETDLVKIMNTGEDFPYRYIPTPKLIKMAPQLTDVDAKQYQYGTGPYAEKFMPQESRSNAKIDRDQLPDEKEISLEVSIIVGSTDIRSVTIKVSNMDNLKTVGENIMNATKLPEHITLRRLIVPVNEINSDEGLRNVFLSDGEDIQLFETQYDESPYMVVYISDQ